MRIREKRKFPDKYKKRMYAMMGVMVMATVALTSCGGTTQGESSTTPAPTQEVALTLDVKEVATSILQGGEFEDQLQELDASMFDVVYQDVSKEDVVSQFVYTNTGASAEQIVVVEAKDNQAAEIVKEALQVKINEDLEQNRDYLPNEVPKLESPVLKVVGNYVFLCVSKDNTKVESVINSLK